MNLTLSIPTPRAKVGTRFNYRYGGLSCPAKIVGYKIIYDTDTKCCNIAYRATFKHLGHATTVLVPCSVVDGAL